MVIGMAAVPNQPLNFCKSRILSSTEERGGKLRPSAAVLFGGRREKLGSLGKSVFLAPIKAMEASETKQVRSNDCCNGFEFFTPLFCVD